MSNIYIQEPPSNGKVLLKTSVGDIDVELWSKETPKASRNFIQLCLEGYYDGTAFHRVVKDFIVQGGDPTDSGEGGESVYGAPFKDEFHSRLRFVRRGLVAMANAGPHDNGSQFFFTMAATPELQNKHTIFGKVVGDTLFNMLKLQEVDLDAGSERPQEPHRILSAEVLNNPFEDIVPRQIKKIKKEKEDEKKVKSKSKATKNFSLLSFGDEAEDDEEQVDKATESFRGKSKSSHDLTDDPRLSSIPAVEKEAAEEEKRRKKAEGSPEEVKPKKSEPEEGAEIKTKSDSPEEELKKKPDMPEEKVKPDISKEEDKKKRRFDVSDAGDKKKSPAVDETEVKKRKVDLEEEHKKSVKEETKEDGRKKKSDAETSHEGKKRKGEDSHKEDRKKRSREGEEEERKRRKGDSKEEDSKKKKKGEEDRDKEEAKKKTKTEGETNVQAGDEERNSKEDTRRKLKKEKEESPKAKEPKSLLGFVEESKQNRMEELKKEQRKLQRDIRDFSKRSADDKGKTKVEKSEDVEEKKEEEVEENDLLAMVKKERQKYKSRKKQLGRRQNREDATLAMLAKFQNKLTAARTVAGDYDEADDEKNVDDEDDGEDMSWMRHKLHFEDEAQKTKVLDANVNDDDRYSISDPRNPLTQRRRESSKKAMREKR